jgi:hypothetical protein
MSFHSSIIAIIKLALFYTLYKPEDDTIRLKHVAVLPKQSYYFHNKILPLNFLFISL